MIGRFITFEGGEGAGKSSQVKRLAGRLTAGGYDVVTTREPGGTPTAEAIRDFVLSGRAVTSGARGEAALMAAARADHVEKVIRPALAGGKWVISDRYIELHTSVPGREKGADEEFLDALERVAIGPTRPDLTIILDLPIEVGLARLAVRQAERGETPDRFERDDLARHEARRKAYLAIAAREPERCIVIDATGSEAAVAEAIYAEVATRLLAAVH